MKPLPHRLGQTLLSLSVSLVCLSSAQAATNLSGRYVVETEDGWRLPTLGEDISYSVFYPSWFLGLGIGEARMREVDACDLRSIDLGNHFAPKWRWHINAAQCVLEDAPEQDFDTGSLRIEHLLGDVEATLNTYVGAGLLKRRYEGDAPFEDADSVAPRLNIGAQWRGQGRWTLRLDHAQSSESYKKTSLSLVAYLGGGTVSDAPAIAVLEGDSSTDDSSQYLVAAPAADPADAVIAPSDTVVVEAAPVANLPSTNIASGENTATERLEDVVSTEPAEVVVAETIEPSVPVLVELPEPTDESTETEAISVVADAVASESAVTPDVNANAGADVTVADTDVDGSVGELADSTQPATVAEPTPVAPSAVATANVCPPIARPLKSLGFDASGTLLAQSRDELRALAGTLARRDNLIGRVALPDQAGAGAAVDNVLETMLQIEPSIAGRLVAEVIPNLGTPVFELYRIKVGC